MSIESVKQFIKCTTEDKVLAQKYQNCNTLEELDILLKETNINTTAKEIQTYLQAQQSQEFLQKAHGGFGPMGCLKWFGDRVLQNVDNVISWGNEGLQCAKELVTNNYHSEADKIHKRREELWNEASQKAIDDFDSDDSFRIDKVQKLK
jgi:hypothetical protein